MGHPHAFMSLDERFDTEPEEYQGPSNAKVDEAIKSREKEVAWLERRLETLILSDEDREQTQDEVQSLRDEIKSLKLCFNR